MSQSAQDLLWAIISAHFAITVGIIVAVIRMSNKVSRIDQHLEDRNHYDPPKGSGKD